MAESAPPLTLRLQSLRKRYGSNIVVEDLSLDINKGEFFTLLGSSGCGKTSTLRMIAGLDHPEYGTISFDGEVWADTAKRIFLRPQKRQIGMVFQSYALWPHMTVFENVSYPLRVRRRSFERVGEVLDLVHLSEHAAKSIAQLSGGQQQRVALARALVTEPRLLLLDEPFSNLDANLRSTMRAEVREIQKRLGLTVVLVTHDQLDAFVLSDRIGVMRLGRFEQIGSATSIYQNPESTYVRDFVGRTLVFEAWIRPAARGGMEIRLPGNANVWVAERAGQTVPRDETLATISVRPEDVQITTDDSSHGLVIFEGKVLNIAYMGDHVECEIVDSSGASVRATARPRLRIAEGQHVRLAVEDPQVLRVWFGDVSMTRHER
jgi:ABC-type Fe3+/spermidine/putrescine transport system ATPase subunit